MATLTRTRRNDEQPAESGSAAPAVSRGTRRGTESKRKAKGWGAYSSVRKATNLDDRLLTIAEGTERVIKFLDEAPFDAYNQHFLRALPKGVKKSYVSAHDVDPDDDGCAICAEGDLPDTYSLFNVIDLGEVLEAGETSNQKPEHKAWRVRVSVTDKIQRIAEARRTSPLNREDLYFVVSVEKNKSGFPITDLAAVKASDLEDDTGLSPLTTEQIEKLSANAYEDKSEVGVKEDSDEEIEAALDQLPSTD